MNTQQTVIEKMINWFKHSVGLKLMSITFLMLLLLIPASMIQSIITERENLNKSVLNEVSSKWANQQELIGPVLCIPLLYEYHEKENESVQQIKYLYLLPEELNIDGKIEPKTLQRGIYQVAVYRSKLNCNGSFLLQANIDESGLKEIQYHKAFLSIGISDLRGIEDHIQIQWGDQKLSVQPGSRLPLMIPSGICADLPDITEQFGSKINFSFQLNLQGSLNLAFVPVGNTTQVHLSSPWNSPSFNGNFIPKTRNISEKGFTADWKVLLLNRNYPQSWVDRNLAQRMQESSFGVNLMMPLDDYQKTSRSAKYAAMTISLIFLVFFLVEILNAKKIHPFQYTLVGLALCLFYLLLISISEHLSFNISYLIAAFISTLLISVYSTSVFKSIKFTAILSATILGIYAFVFVTLQLADYALLMGSIGLTIILALTMYFTRNINWYKLQASDD